MKVAVKIPVWEYERGWGSKIDDHMVCLSVEDAKTYQKEFNAKNDKPTVPDWYMVCQGDPTPIDLTDEQYDLLMLNKRMWLSTLKK